MTESKVFAIQLKGGLDGRASSELIQYLKSKLDEGYNKLLIQMEGVQFISSHGIAFLLELQNLCKELGHIPFVLQGPNDEVMAILQLLGLSGKLPIKKDRKSPEDYLIQALAAKDGRLLEEKVSAKPFYFSGRGDLPFSTLKAEPQIQPMKVTNDLETIKQELKESIKKEMEELLQKRNRVVAPPIPQNTEIPKKQYLSTNKTNLPKNWERIFPCEVCGVQLRVVKIGNHQCPSCRTDFYVGKEGTLRFLEKLSS